MRHDSKIDQIVSNPIFKRYARRIRTVLRVIMRRAKKELPALINKSYFKIFIVILVAIFLSLACILFQVGNRYDKSLYIINVPKGYGAKQVADLLTEKRIIDGRYGFYLIVNLFGWQNKMQAGTYEFTPQMSLIRVAWKIRYGEIIPPMLVKLVFPEGLSIYKMGRLMEKEGVGNGYEFESISVLSLPSRIRNKYAFMAEISTKSLEGYLFPDTYLVPSNIASEQLADIMLTRFNNKIFSYWKKNYKKMKVKLTFHQIITLASIIEKEAAIDSERLMISSVYHNRLRIRMHLGADPTIKYVLERPGKIVSYDDLKIKSPYNTYRNYGLPPGPICNPGVSSVKAAMFPAKSDFLYFVARADGSHVFSKTLVEHQKAQEQTRKERIKKIFQRKPY